MKIKYMKFIFLGLNLLSASVALAGVYDPSVTAVSCGSMRSDRPDPQNPTWAKESGNMLVMLLNGHRVYSCTPKECSPINALIAKAKKAHQNVKIGSNSKSQCMISAVDPKKEPVDMVVPAVGADVDGASKGL